VATSIEINSKKPSESTFKAGAASASGLRYPPLTLCLHRKSSGKGAIFWRVLSAAQPLHRPLS
jgi:hypothetical protein